MINNKIYDLATQAGLITFESIHDSMAVTPSIESVAKARKFAKLIVKECGQYLNSPEFIGRSDLDWAMVLNEHFGVKE